MAQPQLKAGQRILFIGDPTHFSQAVTLSKFKEKKIYGEVGDAGIRRSYYANEGQEVITFKHSLTQKIGSFCMNHQYLQVIPEDQYPEYDRIVEDEEKEVANMAEVLKALCYNPSKVSFTGRKFSFQDKQQMQTNHNYASTGAWNKETGDFEVGVRNYRPQCCAFTKTTADVDVYIPAVWLNYYGYTVYDLVEWCKFLSKCEIGFDYEYCGLGRLHESFKANITTSTEEGYYENIALGRYQSNIYPKGFEGFHRILLKGDKQYKMHTYLRFICLRYIYNNQYWTIPGHAMQIKKTLGKLVTHWEALLMAHLHHPFHGYYNLVSQVDFMADKPRVGPTGVQDVFTQHVNYDRHVDPFQSVETILRKLQSTEKMNATFSYLTDVLTRQELNKFFDEQDYLGLYKYLTLKKAEKEKA